MSIELSPEEREVAAMELALGLLEGGEFARAHAAYARDASLREEVARWEGRFAPLTEEIADAAPPPHVWWGIERQLGQAAANDNRGHLAAWRVAAVSAAAVAAVLAAVLIVRPDTDRMPAPQTQITGRTLVATLTTPEDALQLVATWAAADNRLFVARDEDLRPDGVHSHELWIIPSNGTPRSLGTLPAQSQALTVPAELMPHFAAGATLAISVEPLGGSPTGQPTGPVIASGAMHSL